MNMFFTKVRLFLAMTQSKQAYPLLILINNYRSAMFQARLTLLSLNRYFSLTKKFTQVHD
jgi:hypothetical protein